MALQQSLLQKQQLRLSPSQIQLQLVLQMTELQLEQFIREELIENPLLGQEETGTPQPLNSKGEVQDYMGMDEFAHDERYDPAEPSFYGGGLHGQPMSEQPSGTDFREELKTQFHQEFPLGDFALAEYLIDSLDGRGMLAGDMDDIWDSFSFAQQKFADPAHARAVLGQIQQLDPPGIGATSVRECLLLKLRRMPHSRTVADAIRVLSDHFGDLCRKNMRAIQKSLSIGSMEMADVLDLMGSLGTRPALSGGALASGPGQLMPDFTARAKGDRIEVALCHQRSDDLYVNEARLEGIRAGKRNEKAGTRAEEYIRGKVLSAEWVIGAIRERERNMMKIMGYIADFQKDYFIEGETKLLRPMKLKEVARAAGLDISTVSRIISGKYVATDFGNIKLKDLFSGSLETAHGAVSNRTVRQLVLELVDSEDKTRPLQDKDIAEMLRAKGMVLARRTVTKYRAKLNIPAASRRAR